MIPDPNISGCHAKIVFKDDQCYIEDTSVNGVFIGSGRKRLVRGQPYALRDGDTVYIDNYEVRATLSADTESPTADAGHERLSKAEAELSHVISDLASRFAGREALYLDKGVLFVEVGLPAYNPHGSVDVRVTEIALPGLEDNLFSRQVGNGRVTRENGRLTWMVGAGALSRYGRNFWTTGYGWSMYFGPALLEHFRARASDWVNTNLSADARYDDACRFVIQESASADGLDSLSPVFPAAYASKANA